MVFAIVNVFKWRQIMSPRRTLRCLNCQAFVMNTMRYAVISYNHRLSVRCIIYARLTRRVKSSVSDPSTPLTSLYKVLIFILLIVSAGYWPSRLLHKIYNLCNVVINKARQSDRQAELNNTICAILFIFSSIPYVCAPQYNDIQKL